MKQDTYSHKKFLVYYFLWWLVWELFQTILLHRMGLSWKVSFIDAVVSHSLLGILSLMALLMYRAYQPGGSSNLYRVIYVIGITILFYLSSQQLLPILVPDDPTYLVFLEKSMPLRFFMALLILSFVTILDWMWNNLTEKQERETRLLEAEQLIKDAELVKIRQQLQPHFLFNSLNSISALAGKKPEEARIMIQQLSDFLRGTLKKDEQKSVSFSEELKHMNLYLEIEKVRFGHRLQIKLEIEEDVMDKQLPPLVLQPILENAIKFGLYGTLDKIEILLKAYQKDNFLWIEMRNPFDEKNQTAQAGTGFGLSSIARRLQLLFGRTDLLLTEKKDAEFISTLKIPQ